MIPIRRALIAALLCAPPALAAPPEDPAPAPPAAPDPPAPDPPATEPEEDDPLALTVGGGLRFQTTGTIDLADLAGVEGYGANDDTTDGALGVSLEVGVIVHDRWEVALDVLMAFGGLSITDIEDRYFDAEPQPIGGNATVHLDLFARYLWRLHPIVELAPGLGVGWMTMGASSPAGAGFFQAVQVGPGLELRLRLHGRGEGGGWLALGGDVRALWPVTAEVGSGDEPRFEMSGAGDPIWLVGGGVGYRYDWR